MSEFNFNTHTSLKDKTLRFLKSACPSFIKYSLLSGFVFLIKLNLTQFFYTYFDLPLEKQKASILQEYTNKASENLSLLSPGKISEYISSLTSSTFASAKVVSLEKTIHFLTSFFDTILFLFLIYFAYAFITTTLSRYREKEKENDIANLVVEKLLPHLKNISK